MLNVRVTLQLTVDREGGKYLIDILHEGIRIGGTHCEFSSDPASNLPAPSDAEHDATCYLRGVYDGMAAVRNSITFNNGMVGLMDAMRERMKITGE